jgi:CO/xanthine dehydrogenase Mo-binding subunit
MQIQIAAEELSVPVERITMVLCRSGVTPNQGLTVGSLSSPTQFGNNGLRVALDTARDALYQLASRWLGVDASQLVLKMACFSASGDPASTVSYGELVQGQRFNLAGESKCRAERSIDMEGARKIRSPRRHPAKAKGTYQYVQKVRVPGMLHGKVVRPPALGAKVQSIDKGVLSGWPATLRWYRSTTLWVSLPTRNGMPSKPPTRWLPGSPGRLAIPSQSG